MSIETVKQVHKVPCLILKFTIITKKVADKLHANKSLSTISNSSSGKLGS